MKEPVQLLLDFSFPRQIQPMAEASDASKKCRIVELKVFRTKLDERRLAATYDQILRSVQHVRAPQG